MSHDVVDQMQFMKMRIAVLVGKLNAMHRRAQRAEKIANQSVEQLRNEGVQNFGRALANYAAHMATTERDEARDALGLVPRERGDHAASCLAHNKIGTQTCSCHVAPVRAALGEAPTE